MTSPDRQIPLPCSILLVVTLLAGCPGAVDPTLLDDSGGSDAADAAPDATTDSARLDGPLDGPAVDQTTDLPADLPPADTQPPPACVTQGDPTTLALYTFEGTASDEVVDVQGNHPGKIVGSDISRIAGKGGCGKALAFAAGAAGSYVELPDSPDWDLADGSVDLWVRFDQLGSAVDQRGIISRDANGTNLPGHFSIYRTCDGAVVVRHQLDDVSYYQCSDPVADGVWVHVGVNFGAAGLELFVDGELATREDAVQRLSSGQCTAGNEQCGTSAAGGIDGNDNPWVVGASAVTSDEGKATPVTRPMGGAVDSLRISSARRTFQQAGQ